MGYYMLYNYELLSYALYFMYPYYMHQGIWAIIIYIRVHKL